MGEDVVALVEVVDASEPERDARGLYERLPAEHAPGHSVPRVGVAPALLVELRHANGVGAVLAVDARGAREGAVTAHVLAVLVALNVPGILELDAVVLRVGVHNAIPAVDRHDGDHAVLRGEGIDFLQDGIQLVLARDHARHLKLLVAAATAEDGRLEELDELVGAAPELVREVAHDGRGLGRGGRRGLRLDWRRGGRCRGGGFGGESRQFILVCHFRFPFLSWR